MCGCRRQYGKVEPKSIIWRALFYYYHHSSHSPFSLACLQHKKKDKMNLSNCSLLYVARLSISVLIRMKQKEGEKARW
jgi:hypothetical protein